MDFNREKVVYWHCGRSVRWEGLKMSMPFTGEAGKEAACTYEDYRRLPEGSLKQLCLMVKR